MLFLTAHLGNIWKNCVMEINREINGNEIRLYCGISRRIRYVVSPWKLSVSYQNNGENVSVVNDGRTTIDRFRFHAPIDVGIETWTPPGRNPFVRLTTTRRPRYSRWNDETSELSDDQTKNT